jgi:N-methylhydantoinase B
MRWWPVLGTLAGSAAALLSNLRRSIGPVRHTCEFNGVGERLRRAPWGVFGGARFHLRAADGTLTQLGAEK